MKRRLSLSRRQLLGAAAASGLVGLRPAWANPAGPPRYVLMFIARGGWDPTFCFDPKLGSTSVDGPDAIADPLQSLDVDAVQTFNDLPVVVNDLHRPNVTQFFQNWGGSAAVVNGLHIGSIAHHTCLLRLLTGTADWARPDFLTIVGHELGTDLALGSIDFTGMGNRGNLGASAGRLGLRSQLKALVDPHEVLPAPSDAGYTLPRFSPDDAQRASVREFLDRRIDRFEQAHGDGAWNALNTEDFRGSIRRATMLADQAPSALAKVQVGAVADADLQLELAVELFANDLCRSVSIDHMGGWDTHENNDYQNTWFDDYFGSLNTVCALLKEAGLFEDTMIVACSEMGRSPKLNPVGGKEHWPHTSVMLVGGRVNGGRAFGGTNETLESLPVDLVSGEQYDGGEMLEYDNFVAGIIQSMGADPGRWFPGVTPYVGPLPS